MTPEYLFTAPTINDPADGDTVPGTPVGDGFVSIDIEVTIPPGDGYILYVLGAAIYVDPPATEETRSFFLVTAPGEHTIGIAFAEEGDGLVGAVREVTFTVVPGPV